MTVPQDAPSTVTTELVYYLPPLDGSAPYNDISAGPASGQPQRNWREDRHQVEIENIRGKEDSVTLDTAGFQFFRRAATHKAFTNDAEVEREYYPESIELIKELTGASRAVIFDHTIRRRRPDETEDSPQKRQPVPQVHVDQTTASAVARVHRHLPPSDAPALLRRRFQIINLWRPIGKPAYEWPLALCDFRTVDTKADLVPVTLKYADRNGEIMNVKYNPSHKWKYLKNMEPDELVLIKCFDSKTDDGTALCTPHTAFSDPTTPEGAPLRESIEVRFLVFYD
ncbi:hypothetical protein WOLCODRAFT_144548 [Wolfiporia cocos MD-104 SS10]|uniref:Methyltransferase n=1 Tax=Wolfiporia cocos (strain MD-104) TaxID=742152 RepID=A0A2H3K523_WOLCO|nr:hypothetical protein WOLCODRAFT_144548 [Wolfiporia cocos MD-104 SS10]